MPWRSLIVANEKSKSVNKTLKANITQLKVEVKPGIECKDMELKVMAKNHKCDKELAEERVRGQGRKRANLLRENHKVEVAALTEEHAIALEKMKSKAKSQVDLVRSKGDDKLLWSRRASIAARKRLKVSVLCYNYHTSECIDNIVANQMLFFLFPV